MNYPDSHLSDQQLLLDVEGELSAHEGKMARAHLSACWTCRARRQEFEGAITDFVRLHQSEFAPDLPSPSGPRALLRARMAQLSEASPRGLARFWLSRSLAVAMAACAVLALGVATSGLIVKRTGRPRLQAALYYMPDSRLTPGATVLLHRSAVCSQSAEGNRSVPVSLQRQVFQEYGIPSADPQAYEVDYLVTPALGGADDIHNLWPHSQSTTWNAHVKDALEDRLREMVCEGSLDLGEAQQEIATNWISAYKKYFQVDQPLPEHRRPRADSAR